MPLGTLTSVDAVVEWPELAEAIGEAPPRKPRTRKKKAE
jgi:hypothetical protein